MVINKNNMNIYIKNLFALLFLIASFSCINQQSDKSTVTIDLNRNSKQMLYSEFVDSLSYLTLNTGDSCLLSGVEKMYVDDDKLIIKDMMKGGIFIFNLNGLFIKQINYYGSGPNEFVNIDAFAIDPLLDQVCIYDGASRRINRYTYDGSFVKSTRIENVIRDFAVMPDDVTLFMMPSFRQGMPSGVWTADSENNMIKQLLDDVPVEDQFEFIFTNYNQTDKGVYYYDRNWDKMSFITKNKAILNVQFDLKQRLPQDVRRSDNPDPSLLKEKAMMANFSVTAHYVILTYFTFGADSNPFHWVFVNKDDNSVIVTKFLNNDMDAELSTQNYLFYVNETTLCRMLDSQEEDCKLRLQFLHLKNN